MKLSFYLLLLVAVAAGFVFRVQIYDYFRPKIESKLQELEKTAVDALVGELKKQVTTAPKVVSPPPLRAPTVEIPKTQTLALSVSGTIRETNLRRNQNSLPSLSENAKLDAAAKLRLEDMFAKQYFEHVSPTGESVTDSAKTVGYEYIIIGENLALGNFIDDKDLVDAWMNSPGHRANILNTKYTEIGVALRKGTYEGRTTLIAVQVFGKPLSSCPAVDANLKSQIDALNSELEIMQKDLEARKADIDSTNPHTPGYNKKVDEYNALVASYNLKVQQLKQMVADYNAQIVNFNTCAQA